MSSIHGTALQLKRQGEEHIQQHQLCWAQQLGWTQFQSKRTSSALKPALQPHHSFMGDAEAWLAQQLSS